LSGPVGIFDMTKTIASQGIASLLNWMGLLSVNVGLLNLFPIPALDGGRLLFLGYEAVTKKKPSQKVETALISITMILLLGLMVVVTFNDVLRLFR
ncbi:MAG TPA: site-2 protease family protein, partial [Bacilli bacterium]